MIQPISDKRITGAMDAVIQSGKINAFDDLYDGTIIYPVRGIDRILNQR